jgi:hypothetical protein
LSAKTGLEQMQQITCADARLFDHLVGAGEQCGRHGEAERLRGRKIYDEIELGRLLDRNVGRLHVAITISHFQSTKKGRGQAFLMKSMACRLLSIARASSCRGAEIPILTIS